MLKSLLAVCARHKIGHGMRVRGGIAIGNDVNTPFVFADGETGWIVVAPASQRSISGTRWGQEYKFGYLVPGGSGEYVTKILTQPPYSDLEDSKFTRGFPSAEYCKNINFEGESDFFLPNNKEMETIVANGPIIDSLDETLDQYPQNSMAQWNFPINPNSKEHAVWTCSVATNNNPIYRTKERWWSSAPYNILGIIPARRILI